MVASNRTHEQAGGDTGNKRGGTAGVEQAPYRDGSDAAGCARLCATSKGASELPLYMSFCGCCLLKLAQDARRVHMRVATLWRLAAFCTCIGQGG
jgi:hypothetical protein